MIQVRGLKQHFDKVLMPSECIHRYHDETRKGTANQSYHPLYWGVVVKQPRGAARPERRIAYLIQPNEVQESKRRGSQIIVPAYQRPKSEQL